LIELSENEYLRQQLNISDEKTRKKSKVYKEMRDVEYVLRFFTLHHYWEKFSGNMRNEMDRFMIENSNSETNDVSKLKLIFNNSMELCSEIWADRAFKRPDGRNEMIQGIYDAQAVSLSLFPINKKQSIISNKEKIRDAFNDLYESDKDFQISMRQFTSNIKQVDYRISSMVKTIKESIV